MFLRVPFLALVSVGLFACGSDDERLESTETPQIEVMVTDATLDQTAEDALALAPAWVRDDLAIALLRQRPKRRVELATLLLELEDPRWIDEVAFTIAHLSPEVLKDDDFYLELLVDNADWVYRVDPELSYVDLVEVGEPGVDDDFWTTTTYHTTVDGQSVSMELEREDYYWYVVHPRIEDERPYYIDAWGTCGSDSLQCPTDPETGMFWRRFLWEGAAETCPEGRFCPVLSDVMPDHDLLWNEGGGGDATGAVRGIIDHMKASDDAAQRWLVFGAEGERSIQPNRIYGLGRGNCGEWADMTTALSRTVLIPNVNVTPSSWDHTWSGFWNERWVAWEPVNTWVDHGYGIDYAVYATRGDASVFMQTPDYNTETFEMVVEVRDKTGVPVDGATVAIFSPFEQDGDSFWWSAGERGTDDAGQAVFPLVADREFGFLVTSKLGIYPEEENTLTIGSSGIAAGETDLIVVELSGRKMPSGGSLALIDSEGEATLEVTRSDESGRVLGASWRYGGDGYGLLGAAPLLDTFVVDADGYDAFLENGAVDAVLVDGGDVSVDPSRYWYVVVHNSWSSVTAAVGTLSATLSPGKGATFEGSAEAALRYRLLPGEHVALELVP